MQTLYHSGRLEFIAFCDYAWKYPLMTVTPSLGLGVGVGVGFGFGFGSSPVSTCIPPVSPLHLRRIPPRQVIGPHGRKVQASWIEIRSSSGCGTMTGIFVLAQTGYVKLLPLVPDKFLRDEWVPFGMSDVLLGPSVGLAMTSREPVSSIDRVRIDTDGKLTLLLQPQPSP